MESSMDFLDCKICHNPYDEENHRPRSAPCGHELCTSCIRELIKDSTLLCPKCRKVSRVEVPDDLPITFGLIDVIRSFKTMNISSTKQSESIQSGATNDEICSIHCKEIGYWCLICQIWICDDCLESHTSLLGCSTESINSMKDKNIRDADIILAAFEENVKDVSAKQQEHLRLAEQHTEEANKLRKVLDQGNTNKKNLQECKKGLNTANSPRAVIKNMKVLTQRKQLLRSWSAMNIGTDTPLGLVKQAFARKKDVFIEMVIASEKLSAKLTKHEERILFHTFQKQALTDDSICIPFDDLMKEIPPWPTLVFLELSVGGVVKGQVLVQLNKNIPKIREFMVKIVTGQYGQSLKEVKFTNKRKDDIYATKMPFKNFKLSADQNETRNPTAKSGDILGNFSNEYLDHIFCYVSKTPSTLYGRVHLIGSIEQGMDTLLECHNIHSDGAPMIISDCGLVIENQ